MTQPDFVALAKEYYTLVDAQDFDAMLALFSEDIVYNRCEKTISGKKALELFYTTERKIVGSHKIELITREGNTVIVKGLFSGEDIDEIYFADFFEFDESGLIVQRDTYLKQGFSTTV